MGASGIVAEVVRFAIAGWLVALAWLVLYRCLHGGINMNGLLARSEAQAADGLPSPERVQLLFAFLIATAGYVRLVLQQMQGAAPLHVMPQVPNELIVLFTASHGIYLGGKLGWMFNLKQFISKPGE